VGQAAGPRSRENEVLANIEAMTNSQDERQDAAEEEFNYHDASCGLS
jgi:hypothetical protein